MQCCSCSFFILGLLYLKCELKKSLLLKKKNICLIISTTLGPSCSTNHDITSAALISNHALLKKQLWHFYKALEA